MMMSGSTCPAETSKGVANKSMPAGVHGNQRVGTEKLRHVALMWHTVAVYDNLVRAVVVFRHQHPRGVCNAATVSTTQCRICNCRHHTLCTGTAFAAKTQHKCFAVRRVRVISTICRPTPRSPLPTSALGVVGLPNNNCTTTA